MWQTLRITVIILVVGAAVLTVPSIYERHVSSRFPVFSFNPEADTRQSTWVLPLHQSQGLLLSGLPAYGRMTFLLPLGNGVETGQAYLKFRTEVPDTVYATLRISVNDTRRVETVLMPGKRENQISFALSAEDLSRKYLRIRYSLTGTSTVNICGGDDAAIVVQFLPDSRLEILTRGQTLSAVDRFRIRGGRVSMAWRPVDDQEAGEHLLGAADVINAGIPLSLSDDGDDEPFTPEDVRQILLRGAQDAKVTTWPLAIGVDGANAGTREFTERTVWKHRYKASELPDSRLPGALNYAIRLGPMMTNEGEEREWMLWVKLNGRLLHTRRAVEGTVEGTVDLPAAIQSEENTLEISAGRPFGINGVCNFGPTYIAELLPETRLLAGSVRKDELGAGLRSQMGGSPVLSTRELASLTAPEAFAAARLLTELPARVRLQHQVQEASSSVQVVRPLDLPSLDDATHIYYHRDGQGQIATVEAVRDEPEIRNNAVVLVIKKAAPVLELDKGLGKKGNLGL